jgi:hypothetical protein
MTVDSVFVKGIRRAFRQAGLPPGESGALASLQVEGWAPLSTAPQAGGVEGLRREALLCLPCPARARCNDIFEMIWKWNKLQ